MPRAMSPLDQLEYVGESPVALPTPSLAVGTRLKIAHQDAAYYRWRLLRTLIRDMRKTHRVFAKKYGFNPLHGRLSDHMKRLIRARMEMVDNADSVEVAGAAPWSMHVPHVANECYLRNGQCHSGVDYEYYLLYRRTDSEGRKLVYIPPTTMIRECHAKKCVA